MLGIQRRLWDQVRPQKDTKPHNYLCVNGPLAGQRLQLDSPHTLVIRVGRQRGLYEGTGRNDLIYWREAE
jgi:hypothetical protein